MLAAGLVLVCAGVLLWPSVEADPRTPAWQARVATRPRTAGASPSSDVAVAALLLALALRTGLPIGMALERVAQQCRPDIGDDLLRVATAYERAGDRPLEAWAGVPRIWEPIAAAMAVASGAGVAPGGLLRAAARAILRRENVAAEADIARAAVRLVLPLGLVLLPAFMGTTVLPLVLVMTGDSLAP